ncbi:MAG: hypothetical protein GYA24_20045 [Candidatus Lokiarchaeota archaeon]|nr:hypothetical protein [Candidatus Lokiarchaeota archaeon]
MHAADSRAKPPAKRANYTAILKRQLKFFKSIKAQLLADSKYHEKFVAIKDEAIIGVGDDELDLVEQMQSAHPGQVILVKHVTEQPPTVELPSVEVIG